MTAYGPGQGPGPAPLNDAALATILRENPFAVLATTRRDGRPQLSTVAQAFDADAGLIRISTTEDRLKVRQLRRDPRAVLHVSTPDHLAFAIVEADAELSAVTSEPGDAVGRELLALQPPFSPEDERAFLEQVVKDRRLVIRLHITRLHGTGLDLKES
ncbi:pyridoxamine 5'-phosphate oxidase family protein [Actinomadura rayongensis]|uniref:TIGR03618 family F420-dependent PPOX class oxidoreductase n=1 Tax=Actinomadura rayongensis TaxID=1429076 RepID=A0A6I4WD27_9ACTN|nr:TIGR03618 family F420-dependent PPOX class oxidoreductase [Actinomadura rayongensis]MXQ66690.1 TIGR03618 family F420-dependent PPOX class oxidoreductase [Actinomadura rayongensis]